MKKITKLLSVFVIAGALSAGAGVMAGCSHKHTYSDDWTPDGANGHYHVATCEHTDEHTAPEAHKDLKVNATGAEGKDNKCDFCGYDMTPSGGNTGDNTGDSIALPAGVNNILCEGVTEVYNLSTTLQSVDIPLNGFKVYFAKNDTKDEEVPAGHWKATLYEGQTEVKDPTGLRKDAAYTLSIELINVKGGESIYKDIPIKINNAIASIALKSGTTTQQQSSSNTMTSTWTFEATRANGDKEDLSADKVTIGNIDPLDLGKKSVAVTLNGTSISTTVDFEITAATDIKIQSFAINPGALEAWTGENGADKDLDVANGVSVTAADDKVSKIEAGSREVDGKKFTKRINIGGTWKNGENSIRLAGLNSTTGIAAGATVKTRITIYVTSGSGSDKRFISIVKDGESSPVAGQGAIVTGYNNDAIQKVTFEVTEAGNYNIASFTESAIPDGMDKTGFKSGGFHVYYVQVDKIITGDSAAENKSLGGTFALSELKLDTTSVTKTFKAGDTFSSDGLKVTAVSSNSVTADVKEEVVEPESVSTPDMSKLGEVAVTVTYQGKTATYNITVESKIKGVSGVKAYIPYSTDTTVDAGTTYALDKSNIKVEILGENSTAKVKSFIVKDGDNEADLSALAIGTHTFKVVATVEAGDITDVIETTITVEVLEKAEASSLTTVELTAAMGAALEATTLRETKVLAEGAGGKIFITAGAGADQSVDIDGNNKTIEEVAYTKRIKTGGSGTTEYRSFGFEVKAGCKIILFCCSSSSSATREVQLMTADGEQIAKAEAGGNPERMEFTVTKAGTYYVATTSGGLNVYGAKIEYSSAAPASLSLEALPPKQED